MARLLILSNVHVEPKSSAAGRRMLQLIRAFVAKDYQITFATTAAESEHAHDLSIEGVARARVEVNDSSFDAWVRQLDPTLVLFDRFMVEEQFGWRVKTQCESAIRILDTEDLHCLRYAREAAVKEKRSFIEEDLFREIAFREIASILRCDISLMISSYEMALLQRVFRVDASLLHYLPFLEDPLSKEVQQSWLGFEHRSHFISIGNFMHAPNKDAVKQLKEVIWPKIRARLPTAELHVYGAYPTQQVLEWNDPNHGFLVKGRAEDAEAVIGQARVMLAPLRFGAGLKGKLIDAMRCGTPNVTSPIGAEGMLLGKEWPGRVEDESDAFAIAAVDLYSEEARWNEAQMHCADLINGAFNGKGHTLLFWNRLDHLMAELEQHRKENFTGGMLWHHSMRSTEYMSKWIEAKNKG
ncbi:MAG: glycosyltransferase [Flavobacteriales bacterium]|nr:glycosyltransferase [Flavobacteriales bacterium]